MTVQLSHSQAFITSSFDCLQNWRRWRSRNQSVPLHDTWWLSCSCQGDSVCCLGYRLSCPGPAGLQARVPALSLPWVKEGKETGLTQRYLYHCLYQVVGTQVCHVIWSESWDVFVERGGGLSSICTSYKRSQVVDSSPKLCSMVSNIPSHSSMHSSIPTEIPQGYICILLV